MAYRPSARQLEYLIALIETGHFGAAARKCNVSQPTLSAQFKLLEDQLGVALMDRSGRVVKPTPAGEALVPLARQALETLDSIVLAATARKGGLGGLVRLGVAPTFGPYFLPHVLPRLRNGYPDLELYIREERPANLLSELPEGKMDCVLVPAPVRSEQLDVMPLCEEEIWLGLPADHSLAGHEVLPLRSLEGERLLTLGQGYRLYDETQALCLASGALLQEDYEGTSLDAVRQMVSIGMGLSLFPAGYIASEFRKEDRVVLRRIEDFPMVRQLLFVWRSNSVRRSHYEILVELARETVREIDIPGLNADEGPA